MLDIAVVIPELAKYGGAERFLIECVSRWQDMHKITIYASRFNHDLLAEHNINRKVGLVEISGYFQGPHALVLNCTLLPKIWEQEIGEHEIYNTHLLPTHLIDLHPAVWFPHEPLRLVHDLRHNESLDQLYQTDSRSALVYPKYNYDQVSNSIWQASLNSVALFDKLGNPDRIVANSRYTASYLEQVYGWKVTDVVYPGVNFDQFITTPLNDPTSWDGWSAGVSSKDPDPKRQDVHKLSAVQPLTSSGSSPALADLPDENVILAIGQLWSHKRTDRIIEAIRQVENVQLYLVGSGPEKEKLQGQAETLGVANRVFFLSDLSHLELQILFARSLAVVFTPIREPFGIVALEAMAAAKPLIAVNEGGFTEVVDDSCSFLVPARPGAIAEKIRYLRDNKDIARKMGLAGRRKARQFTWDRSASQLLSIIEETSADWRRTRPEPRTGSRQTGPLFGAQYYCWYGSGIGSRHWNDNPNSGTVTDMPVMGYYASSQGITIEEHIKMMQQMGLDFAILNLHIDSHGVNPYEMTSIENFFSLAQQTDSPLRLAVQVCLYDCGQQDIPPTLNAIRRIARASQNYLRSDDKPVLFIFWTGTLDGQRNWINLLQDNTDDFVRIACSLRMYDRSGEKRRTYGLFDGWSLFSPLELAARSKWTALWRQAYHNSSAGNMNLRIITISPGYDDTHLQASERKSNPHRTIERHGGETYQQMTDFALSVHQPPDMVIVSTFNEYHENTHVEPSANYGSKYMEMTRRFIRVGKETWTRS